jgi:hypothetical protein
MTRLIAALVIVSTVSACGGFRDSRLNPLNWFGRSEERETTALPAAPEDPRGLVGQVVSMQVEEIPTGAIVRATGITPTQGWWDAELVAQPLTEDGVLVLDFRIFPPIERTDVNTPQSREVTVALSLSRIALEPVREIVVQGRENARAARR